MVREALFRGADNTAENTTEDEGSDQRFPRGSKAVMGKQINNRILKYCGKTYGYTSQLYQETYISLKERLKF